MILQISKKHIASNYRIVSDHKLEITRKKIVMEQFETLFCNLPGRNEENYGNLQDSQLTVKFSDNKWGCRLTIPIRKQGK
jgi:hypothetical protein